MGSERKVLNKYFPPDYDPSKVPRVKRIGGGKRQYNIRTMAPFNMRCNTCNGYIYKARKFNSRMEQAEDIEYLGLRHYRFFIRCSTCCAEIVWRTDIEKQDYIIESGAKRSFEALKTAEEHEAKRIADEEEEIAHNPMKLMEKRTEQSRIEMESSEMLEDIKELNKRQAGFHSDYMLLRNLWKQKEAEDQAEKEADDEFIRECLELRNNRPKLSEIVDSQPVSDKVHKQEKPKDKVLHSFNDDDEDEETVQVTKEKNSLQSSMKEPSSINRASVSNNIIKSTAGSKRPPSFANLHKSQGKISTNKLFNGVVAIKKPLEADPVSSKTNNPLGLDYSASDSD